MPVIHTVDRCSCPPGTVPFNVPHDVFKSEISSCTTAWKNKILLVANLVTQNWAIMKDSRRVGELILENPDLYVTHR